MRITVTLCAFIALVGCSRSEVAEKTFPAMGGIPFTIKAYDVPPSLFDETAQNIEQEVLRLEKIFSRHDATSELARINAQTGGMASDEMMALVRLSLRFSTETDGAFDITVGPLVDLYSLCEKQKRPPTPEEIEQRLAIVGYRNISLSGERKIAFQQPNVSLDFGGIAKGYIADAAARMMKRQGIRRGIADAGGNLVLFNSVGEEPFKVGVKNPEDPTKNYAVMTLDSGGVATSGCYERYYRFPGASACHVLDPRTGLPSDSLLSATVTAQEGVAADALTTACLVMGIEKCKALVNSLPGVEAFLIWKEEGRIQSWLSEGLQGKVRILE